MSKDRPEEDLFVQALINRLGLPLRPERQRPGLGPDFLLAGDESPIGVEVTRVHRRSEPGTIPRQQMEGIRSSLLRRAKTLWDAQGYPPAVVRCHFNSNHTPFITAIPEVASLLVRAAAQALESSDGSEPARLHRPEDPELPPAVHTLFVHAEPSEIGSIWLANDSEWGASLEPATIQQRIDAKAAKLATYQRPSSIVWLLLVMDSRAFSGAMAVSDTTLSHTFVSPFQVTYLMDFLHSRGIWRLQSCAAAT